MRLRTTHRITIYGEEVVGTNELNVELTEATDPLVEADARYRPQGDGLVREPEAPRIDRSPEVVVRPIGRDPDTGAQVDVMDVVEPGQRCDVSGVSQQFAIDRVVPHNGRSGEPHRITIELGAVSDE